MKQRDFGAIRQDLVALCGGGKFIEALLTLEDSGLSVQDAPELWEYLERRLTDANQDRLAGAVRARLAEAGTYTTQMALTEAQSALDDGAPHRAEQILRAVFGTDDLPPPVARVMARALAGTSDPGALDHIDRLADADSDMALLKVDTLRAEERLFEARASCEAFAKKFPNDSRFRVRLARISNALNQWDDALGHWGALSDWPGFQRSVALGSRIRLLTRLERRDEAHALFAEFLLEKPDLSDLVIVGETLGLSAFVEETIARAARRNSIAPLTASEWDAACRHLLDNGRLGHVVWLATQGIPVGPTATEALNAAGRVMREDRLSISTLAAAKRLTSYDALLPFPPWFRLRKPALERTPSDARVMLVNAALGGGGAERQFVMMVRALQVAGLRPDQIDVVLFSLSEDRGRAHFLDDLVATGVRVHDLQTRPRRPDRLDPDFRDRCQLLPSPLRGDVVTLHDLVEDLKPDVLHGWQDRASLACGFVGAHLGLGRIVMSARNMQPAKRDRNAQIDDRPMYEALCALPNVKLTANSVAGARDYEDWLGLANGDAGVMNNALDFSRFSKRANRKRKTGAPVRIVGVFRFAPNKRPLLWLDTVRALQKRATFDIRPRMVGVGPLEDEVRAYAQKIGLEHFEIDGGLVHPKDIYGDADMILLMSRIEGTPNVLLEAQAMGIAAVGCDVGGVREAVLCEGEGAGLVLAEDISAEDAAAEIEAWLPEALAAKRDARVAYIQENFSLETLGARALNFYGLVDDEGAAT